MARLLHYTSATDEFIVLLDAGEEDAYDDPDYEKTVYEMGIGNWPTNLPTDRPLTP